MVTPSLNYVDRLAPVEQNFFPPSTDAASASNAGTGTGKHPAKTDKVFRSTYTAVTNPRSGGDIGNIGLGEKGGGGTLSKVSTTPEPAGYQHSDVRGNTGSNSSRSPPSAIAMDLSPVPTKPQHSNDRNGLLSSAFSPQTLPFTPNGKLLPPADGESFVLICLVLFSYF